MISAIIITYNEEDVLEDALKSLSGFADEIVLVDSNSTDKTQSIAQRYKAKIISHKLISFAEQRNVGLEHASGEFVFYLDADESLTSEFKTEALRVISNFEEDSNIAGFYIKRKTYYFNKDWGLTDRVQRLFFKKRLKSWYGDVHETPRVEGELLEISSPIIHSTHRNLSQMLEKTNKWSDIEAKLRFDSNHPRMSWWRFPRVMIPAFLKSYIQGKGYKNGTKGVIEGLFQAYSMFITYAKLWEMQKGR